MYVEDYLTFNRTEQRGIIILLFVLFSLVLANILIPSETLLKPVDFSSFDREADAFEKAWQKAADEEDRFKRERTQKNRRSLGSFYSDTSARQTNKQKISFVVELNSADTFDLQRLKGIGPAFARRIVNYREKLGGFLDKSQLLEVFGMDSVRYGYLSPFVIVNADSVRKIDLNAVTFKELLRHPYFPFELTRAIMIYRQKNKRFSCTEELKKVVGINDSVFRQVASYVQVKQ